MPGGVCTPCPGAGPPRVCMTLLFLSDAAEDVANPP